MEETIYMIYVKRKFEYGRWSIYVQTFKVSSPYKICRLHHLIEKSRFYFMHYAGIAVPVFGLFKDIEEL